MTVSWQVLATPPIVQGMLAVMLPVARGGGLPGGGLLAGAVAGVVVPAEAVVVSPRDMASVSPLPSTAIRVFTVLRLPDGTRESCSAERDGPCNRRHGLTCYIRL